jgi:hypothetical protein
VVRPHIERKIGGFETGETLAKFRLLEKVRRWRPRCRPYALVGVPRRDLADAFEAAAAGGDVPAQNIGGLLAEPQIDHADNAGTGAHVAIAATRRHGGHAVDEFGLAERAQFAWPIGPVHGETLNEDRLPDVVAALQISEQVRKQIAPLPEIPEMVVRVDDRQVRLKCVLDAPGQPVGPHAQEVAVVVIRHGALLRRRPARCRDRRDARGRH